MAMVHSEPHCPAWARRFYAALAGPKQLHWLTSRGQVDFYDEPAWWQASDLVVAHLKEHLR